MPMFFLQHAVEAVAVPASADPFMRIAVALVTLIVGITPVINHVKGKRRDTGRKSEYSELRASIKENHTEIRTEVRELRETLTLRMDTIEAIADDAQADAIKALHAAIGVDGENGTRGEVRKLGDRVDGLEERERDHLANRHALGPTDVGTLTPRVV